MDESAELGPRTTVWHLAQIREDARLGRDCIVGRGAYVGPGVVIGNQVKLQNYALVYEPATLEDQVFIGPAVVLTNDVFPRATDVTGKLKRPEDWKALGVLVRQGASVGARAVVLPGVEIGCWALVAAGAPTQVRLGRPNWLRVTSWSRSVSSSGGRDERFSWRAVFAAVPPWEDSPAAW